MELLRTVRQRSLLSELSYYALNVGLAVVLFVVSQTIQSPLLAVALMLLSKWRVFAVRPRHWWVNIQANMVDTIVGLGIVALMYLPGSQWPVQAILAVLYACWLVVLKPMSKQRAMLIQSLIALGLGTTALLAVSYEWPVLFVVLCMWIIGYSAARHFLYSYEEPHIVFLSMLWGILVAEIGWLAHYWTFSYVIPGAMPLRLPQATIILLLLAFVGERLYRSWARHGRIVSNEVILPATLAVLVIMTMLLFFNSVAI